MSAKEFFTAINMLDTYNKIMNINNEPKPVHSELCVDTRELGRYRSYVYREKMLRREILELTASRIRYEKMLEDGAVTPDSGEGLRYKRGKSELIDLWLELSKVLLRKRELEHQLELISEPFIRKVVRHRYFSDSCERLHSWAQTASELELPLTGVQLQQVVTKALRTNCF